MLDIWGKWLNELATEQYRKGKGTSVLSKLLTLFDFHVLVFTAVMLFKDHHYIPLIIFILLGFTPIGFWVAIGILIYFIVIGYWIGVILLFVYSGIGMFSYWYELRSIKNNILAGKTGISPFERMPDLLIYIIVQLVLFGSALITKGTLSIILWILYGMITLFFISRLYFRIGAKWRQIHFPLMIRYSKFIAKEMLMSEKEGREQKVENALVDLIASALPGIDKSAATPIVDSALQKLRTFSDRERMRYFVSKKYPKSEEGEREAVLDAMANDAASENNWFKVRYTIAEIIEHDFGEDERIKYIFQVFCGNVK